MTREAPKRKPREAPPPGDYIRSASGTPAELCRTSRTTADGRWLYRLWYGTALGTQEWTREDLVALPGVRWMSRRPKGLTPRRIDPPVKPAPSPDDTVTP